MPVITPNSRPSVQAATDSFQYPKKTIQAGSTGIAYGKPEEQPAENVPVDKPVETPTPKSETTLSPQLTALARKEQALRKQELAMKAEREVIQKQREEVAKYSEIKAKLDAKDYSALEALGVKYDDYTQYLLNSTGQVDPRDQKIQELEQKLNKFEDSQKQAVDKQYQATISQYEKDIQKQIDTNPEYESLKVVGANKHVLQHILDTFQEDNEVLSVEEACRDIREAFAEEAELYNKAFKPKQPAEEKKLPAPKQPTTLSSSMSAVSAPTQPKNQFQHMSARERLAAAIAKAQQQKG